MSSFYLDTSAIVKRYIPETGSAWVRALTDDEANLLSVTELTRVEVASALARRTREGAIDAGERNDLFQEFSRHCADRYRSVPAGRAIIDSAAELTRSHPLRAYDAVHLATALSVNEALLGAELPALMFVSADDRLNEAAVAEGLATDNPSEHP